MLLLNQLLISNGCPLSIMDDPNKFDALSHDELIKEVIAGMRNTFMLIDEKNYLIWIRKMF